MMERGSIRGVPSFCSWSGGKDSALSLYRAIHAGSRIRFLLTILEECGERSRSHGLPLSVLQQQAVALGIPLVTRPASWSSYEAVFISSMEAFKRDGVEMGIFGDIDLEEHREWARRVCSTVGIRPVHPLWKQTRRELLDALLRAGFRATIIAVKDGILDASYLGRDLGKEVVTALESEGVDVSGEQGEYHTVITDGPIFSEPVRLELGEQVARDGYRFLQVAVADTNLE